MKPSRTYRVWRYCPVGVSELELADGRGLAWLCFCMLWWRRFTSLGTYHLGTEFTVITEISINRDRAKEPRVRTFILDHQIFLTLIENVQCLSIHHA